MDASNQEAFFNSYILHCYGIKRGTNIEEANSFFVSVSDNICSEGAASFLLSVIRALNDMTIEYDDYVAIICARHIQDCCLQSPLVSTETLVLLESAVLEVLAKRAMSGTMTMTHPFQNQYEKTLAAILIAYLKFDAFPNILSSASLCSPVVASCKFAILQKVAEVFLDNRVVLSGSGSNYLEFINFPNNKYNVGLAYSNIVAESSRMSIKVTSICTSICTMLFSAANVVSASSPSSPHLSSSPFPSLSASIDDLELILEPLNNGISEFSQCIACLSRWNESLGNLFASSSWTLQIVLDHAISNNLCPISDNAILHLIDATEKLQLVSSSIGGCGSISKLRDLLTSLHELLVSYILQSTNSFDTSVSNISHGVLEAVVQGLVPPKDIVSELKHVVSGAYTMRYFHSLVDISEMIAGNNISDWQLATLRHFVDTSEVDSIINSTMTRCSFLVVDDSEVGDDGDTRNMSLLLTIAENLATIVDKFMCFLSERNKLRDFIVLFLQSKFGVSLTASASSPSSASETSMFWSRTCMSSSTSQVALALGAMSQLYCIPHCHIAESLLEVLSVFPKLGSEASTFLSSLGPTVGVFLCHISINHCRIPRSINPANILVYERKLRSLWNNSSFISRKNQNPASDVLSLEDDNALDTRIHFRQEMPTLLSSLCKNWNYYNDISENLYQRTIAHIDRMSSAIQGLLASPSSTSLSADAEAGGGGSGGGGVESAPTIDACTWAILQNELELLIYSCYVLADVAGETASSVDCPARRRWDEFMAVLTIKFKALASVLIETKTCDELFLVVIKRFLELWIRYLDLLTVSVGSLSDTVATMDDTSFSHSEIACNLIQLACSIFELNSIDLMTISSHIIWCMWYNHPVLVYNFSSPLSQWYDRILFGQLSPAAADRGSQSLAFSNIDDPQFHERLFFSFGKSIMFLNSEEEFVSLYKKSFDLIFLTLDLCTKPTSEVSISENLRLCKISLYQLKGLIKGVYSSRSIGSDDAEDDDDDDNVDDGGEDAANAKITLATASECLKSNFYVIITGLLGLTLWLQKEIFLGHPSVSLTASTSAISAISEGDIEVANQMLVIVSSTLTNICESLQLEEGLIVDIISKLQEIFSQLGANSSALFSFAASIIRNSIHPSFHSAKSAFFDLTASILQVSMSLISSDEGITVGRSGDGASKAGAYVEGVIRVYHNLISDVVRDVGDTFIDDNSDGGSSGGYAIDAKLIELSSFFINMTNSFTRMSFSHDLVVEASMVRIVIAAVRASADLYSGASSVDLSLIGSVLDASTALYETCLTALFSNEVSVRSRKFNSQLLEAQAKLLFHFISNGLHEVVIPRMTSTTQAILQAVSLIPVDSSTTASAASSSSSSSSSTPLKTSLIDPSVLFGELSTAIGTADFNSFKSIINKTFKILNSKT